MPGGHPIRCCALLPPDAIPDARAGEHRVGGDRIHANVPLPALLGQATCQVSLGGFGRRVRRSVLACYQRILAGHKYQATASRLRLQEPETPFLPRSHGGVEDLANQAGYAVILCNSDDSLEKKTHYLQVLEEQRVRGVLITPVQSDASYLHRFRQRGIYVILLDRPSPLPSVRQPKYEPGRTAAELPFDKAHHAGSHQHKHIVYQPELIVRESSR